MTLRLALICPTARHDDVWSFCHFAARTTDAQLTLIDPTHAEWKEGLKAVQDVGYDCECQMGHRLSVLRSDRPLPDFDHVFASHSDFADMTGRL